MAQFKQGVRSVAGKLSVFANGVMTSIQVREAELGWGWGVAVSRRLCYSRARGIMKAWSYKVIVWCL